jgi:hypothetical protein
MNNGKRLLIAAVTTVFALVSFSTQVLSQSGQQTGSGLSISPTRTELRIEPGSSDVVKINLRNVTNGDITAKAFINDFESDNETGEPRIVIDESRESATSIRSFLKDVNDIELKEGENKSFDIPVEIPADAAPGAYYGIIRYAAIPVGSAPSPGQVSLTASVSTIVLIEVPGDIRQQIQVREVLAYRKGIAGTFFTSKPEEAGVRVLNQGNGFVKPFGTVTVSNPLGKQVHQYEINDSDPRSNVLPNSGRVFRNELKGVSTPGRYVITANVSFGNGGEVLTARKSFWYLPWWFVLLILVFVILVGVGVFWLQKRISNRRFKKSRK